MAYEVSGIFVIYLSKLTVEGRFDEFIEWKHFQLSIDWSKKNETHFGMSIRVFIFDFSFWIPNRSKIRMTKSLQNILFVHWFQYIYCKHPKWLWKKCSPNQREQLCYRWLYEILTVYEFYELLNMEIINF